MTLPIHSPKFVNAPNQEIQSSHIYKKKIFCFFYQKRLIFTTADGNVFDVAIRTINQEKTSKISKRFLALKIDHEKIVLLNKNSLKKRVNFSNELIEKIVSKGPRISLENLMRIKKNIDPIVHSISKQKANVSLGRCQLTAFKIASFAEETLAAMERTDKDFLHSRMDDGRPFMVFRNKKTKQLEFIVNISYKISGQASLIGSGSSKKIYRYYNFSKQKDKQAASFQIIENKNALESARNELKHFETFKNSSQIMNIQFSKEFFLENNFGKPICKIVTVMKRYDGDCSVYLKQSNKQINLEIFRKIVKGVLQMHNAGIIHRDLKFTNVLYKVKNNTLSIKIIDLGLSCHISDEKRLSSRAGTSFYRAPEVIGIDPKLDPSKIDSWSLGIMLYQIYFKKNPFSRRLKQILHVKKNGLAPSDCKNYLLKEIERLQKNLNSKKNPWVKLIQSLLDPNPITRTSVAEASKQIDTLLHFV